MSSPFRNKILELFDEGSIGKDELVTNLVNFLSESDAKEFWEQYYEEDEPYGRDDPYEEDDYDGQPDEAQEWHDFDPDC